MKRLAIFASGNGSNFEAIVQNSHKTCYEVVLLFCDRKQAYVIERAKKLNIPFEYLSAIQEKENYEVKILALLEKYQIDFIALAGYMKIIGQKLLSKWEGRILNIHPSYLPEYSGIEAIERAYHDKHWRFGVTIHFVDAGMDTGKIVFQDYFLPKKNESLEDVVSKVHMLENENYWKIIDKILRQLY